MIQLTTDRLRLRPLSAEDADAVFAYRRLPEIARYQGFQPTTLDEVTDFIARHTVDPPGTPGRWLQLAIEQRSDGLTIGDCGLHTLDPPGCVEVGITLAPTAQGAGFAAEALTAVIDWLFEELEVHRVFGSADPRNLPSIRLMERIGMRREGLLRASVPWHGGWADDAIFAVLRQEWRTLREPVSSTLDHSQFMEMAIAATRGAESRPFGCVIVDERSGQVVAEGVNRSNENPVLHGEMDALLRLSPVESGARLWLYTTAEPCPMCAAAAIWAGVDGIVFGASIADLLELGWPQIHLPSRSVVDVAHSQPTIIAGVLRQQCLDLFRQARTARS